MKLKDKWQRGLPYVGNKSKKVEQIIANLPEAQRFVDVFGGGGCVSLSAAASGKYNHVIYNDIRKTVVELLQSLVYGKDINLMNYVYITRQQFYDWRDNQPDSVERTLILLCWSFGNNMNDYLWGSKIEDQKLNISRALFYGDTCTSYDELFDYVREATTIHDKYSLFHKWRKDKMGVSSKNDVLQRIGRLQQLQQLQQLEKLQQLEQLERLEFSTHDYRNLEIKKDDLVYLDPPYTGTAEQYDGFNHNEFEQWIQECPADNIYISEYTKLPHTEVAFNLGKKHRFVSNAKQKDELLLKVIK